MHPLRVTFTFQHPRNGTQLLNHRRPPYIARESRNTPVLHSEPGGSTELGFPAAQVEPPVIELKRWVVRCLPYHIFFELLAQIRIANRV